MLFQMGILYFNLAQNVDVFTIHYTRLGFPLIILLIGESVEKDLDSDIMVTI